MKLQNIFLQLKGVNRIIISNDTCSSVSSRTLSRTVCDSYNASCVNNMQDPAIGSRQSVLLNNVTKQYHSKVQNNLLVYPRIVSSIILCNGEKNMGCKTYYSSQGYVRYFSSANIDHIAEVKVPVQFSGIFKTISESPPIKIAQDTLVWIHDYTSLPWWLVIILTTITMRTIVTLPLSLYQVYIWILIHYSITISFQIKFHKNLANVI